MPLRLDVKRKLTARSDRVKSVDLHPTEPWMLASLYNGNVHVWNTESQQLVKSFEVCDLPVRAAKFVGRKNWVVTGSDDMHVRVFNYNTLERVHQFEAHSDYVRCIAVHPTQPFILTCSDDMTIKLWNWDKKWTCQQTFDGHSHYVMQIVINPKDNNTFASASLDRTLKVWQLGSTQPNFTLEGHQRGVNCVDYYHGGDKPYLISGADDSLVKIWDYQNKTCVQTLEGHSQNVSSVCFHPELPIILTGSEDCTVRVWHANTYRLENTLNYGLDRVWCIAALKGSNNICFGYDEGSVMVKLGREEPAMSMDVSGKIIWAKHSEIQQANLKAMGDTEAMDGERLPLAVKDLGACDIYPQTIAHNPNGRFVVVCGDGEYIIYTAMALRNKAFGPALEFVWALDSSEYAIRESNFSVKLFKNFKEKKTFKPDYGCEGIFGGYLLGCRSSATGLAFYDWETQELVRRIEIAPRQVFWSENGEYVCIATEENYFILKYSAEAVIKARETKEGLTEDGIEDAFDLVGEVQETVKTGRWVGDCFIYTNSVNRLNYYVGGEIVTIAHLDRVLYLLGYIPKDNRLYLGDKELNVVSYELLVSVLEYQTAVMRRDFDTADRVLPTIPPSHRTRVAHFLEKQGFKKQALAVSTDPEHRFDLALSLSELEVCLQLASEAGSEHKWRLVADLAQQRSDLQTAQTCLLKAHDYAGLLLQATSSGNADLMKEVGREAESQGRNNVGFLSYFLTGQLHQCLELLIKTNRIPEAAFFARTYLPSEMSRIVGLWKAAAGEKVGASLADPAQYDNLFPGLKDAVKTEQFLEKQRKPIPASAAPTIPGNHDRNTLEEMRAAEESGSFIYISPAQDPDTDNTTKDAEFVDAPQDEPSNLLEDELLQGPPPSGATVPELPITSDVPLVPTPAPTDSRVPPQDADSPLPPQDADSPLPPQDADSPLPPPEGEIDLSSQPDITFDSAPPTSINQTASIHGGQDNIDLEAEDEWESSENLKDPTLISLELKSEPPIIPLEKVNNLLAEEKILPEEVKIVITKAEIELPEDVEIPSISNDMGTTDFEGPASEPPKNVDPETKQSNTWEDDDDVEHWGLDDNEDKEVALGNHLKDFDSAPPSISKPASMHGEQDKIDLEAEDEWEDSENLKDTTLITSELKSEPPSLPLEKNNILSEEEKILPEEVKDVITKAEIELPEDVEVPSNSQDIDLGITDFGAATCESPRDADPEAKGNTWEDDDDEDWGLDDDEDKEVALAFMGYEEENDDFQEPIMNNLKEIILNEGNISPLFPDQGGSSLIKDCTLKVESFEASEKENNLGDEGKTAMTKNSPVISKRSINSQINIIEPVKLLTNPQLGISSLDFQPLAKDPIPSISETTILNLVPELASVAPELASLASELANRAPEVDSGDSKLVDICPTIEGDRVVSGSNAMSILDNLDSQVSSSLAAPLLVRQVGPAKGNSAHIPQILFSSNHSIPLGVHQCPPNEGLHHRSNSPLNSSEENIYSSQNLSRMQLTTSKVTSELPESSEKFREETVKESIQFYLGQSSVNSPLLSTCGTNAKLATASDSAFNSLYFETSILDSSNKPGGPGSGLSRPPIDQAQLERELELDLENVRIEDNDTNDVHLDEEDLLAD